MDIPECCTPPFVQTLAPRAPFAMPDKKLARFSKRGPSLADFSTIVRLRGRATSPRPGLGGPDLFSGVLWSGPLGSRLKTKPRRAYASPSSTIARSGHWEGGSRVVRRAFRLAVEHGSEQSQNYSNHRYTQE